MYEVIIEINFCILLQTGDPIKIIGIGDFGASNSTGDTLKTFALGSCVAVIISHKSTGTVGMVHVALPDSSISRTGKAKTKPGYFADTGIPTLLKHMRSMGCVGPVSKSQFSVKIAGGASVLSCSDIFQIGRKNVYAIKNILDSYGLNPIAADIGGNISRTVSIVIGSEKISVTSPAREEWKL